MGSRVTDVEDEPVMSDFCSGRIDAGFQSKKLELVCQLERLPIGRLDRPRARTVGGQPADPPAGEVHRRPRRRVRPARRAVADTILHVAVVASAMRSSLQWMFGGSIALSVGGACYSFVDDAIFATITGLVWGIGISLLIHADQERSFSTTGADWRIDRWIGLGSGGITMAAFLGVSPSLPISAELRFGLGVLVIGTGLLATATAMLAEAEQQDETGASSEMDNSTTGDSESTTAEQSTG